MAETTQLLLRPERDNLPPAQVVVGEHFTHEVKLLEQYRDSVTYDGRSLNHPVRTCAYLSDFSNGQLNDEVFATALLHDVAQTAWPEDKRSPHLNTDLHTRNATRLLRDYATSSYAKERLPGSTFTRWEYISALLSDLNVVEEYAENNRGVANGKSPELLELLSGHSIGDVKKEFWLEPGALTRPAKMAELLGYEPGDKQANLEAVLIKAAEKLDSLFRPPENDRSLLRNVHDAESFYAPLCEIIGYDGLATALRSQVAIIRLQKSGHGAFVDKAQEITHELGDKKKVLGSIEGLLGRLSVGEVIVDHAFRDTTGHGITLGTAMLELPSEAGEHGKTKEARAIWRIKSVGSLAMKLLRDHKDLLWQDAQTQQQELAKEVLLPADILGITVVAQEDDTLASLFTQSAMAAYDNPDISLTNAPSREQAFHISGPSSFERKVVGAITLDASNRTVDGKPKIEVGDIDIPHKNKKYSVAKFTCEYDGMRTEIQFQTQEARTEARVGLAAHLLYKLKKQLKEAENGPNNGEIIDLSETEIAAMRDMHDRAAFLGEHVLMDVNNDRRKRFIRRISRWGWR